MHTRACSPKTGTLEPVSETTGALNDPKLDATAVTELYGLVGWNAQGQRTPERTSRAIQASVCYASAVQDGRLVGFGRISGDDYAAQIVDVITHPGHRHQGIATRIMHTLLNAAKDQVLGLVLVDGSGFSDFYERFGFTTADPTSDRLMYWTQRSGATT